MTARSSIPAERVESVFRGHFEAGQETGASVCLWTDDGPVVSLAGGWREREMTNPWGRDTLVPVWSATKGPASAALLHAMAAHGLDPDSSVDLVWPRLPVSLTFGQLMSHQGGLAALDRRVDVFDHAAVVAAIEDQRPSFRPPEHGYHPRTFGCLLDELVRRITGAPNLGAYWHEALARPNNIDFWIGLPESEDHRVARLVPGRPEVPPEEEEFYRAFNTPGTLSRRAFQSPHGLHTAAEMNQAEARRAALPGFGGLGTAEGLAKFYHLLGSKALLGETATEWCRRRRADGPDSILLLPTAFGCGFMLDPLDTPGRKLRQVFGPHPEAFGHPGAGGSQAFFDPGTGAGFAYVMNRMALGVLPGARARALVSAWFEIC